MNTAIQQKPETTEIRKRQAVFTQPRKTVLIRLAMKPIIGLYEQKRDEASILAKRQEEAQERGLNANAYRQQQADTGFQLFYGEKDIKLNALFRQLEERKLHYTGGHWFKGPKGHVNVLVFSTEGEATDIPPMVKADLGHTIFASCTVWCNLKTEGRVDTVTCNVGHFDRRNVRQLLVEGNTYRLR